MAKSKHKHVYENVLIKRTFDAEYDIRQNLPKEKGVIDFAINLIDFEDEYLNAFY